MLICNHSPRKNPNPNEREGKSQPQQSHLMDLLDISLGATSISGPSQSSDPWGMPVAESRAQVI